MQLRRRGLGRLPSRRSAAAGDPSSSRQLLESRDPHARLEQLKAFLESRSVVGVRSGLGDGDLWIGERWVVSSKVLA